jgi:predicted Ser/Thr protein kinase
MIGELVDHYRVLELLGSGAMGVVYKALDVNLDRLVAIKVMGSAARNDPDFVERFRQEARLQGALNHPNVALLFDYFIHNDTPVAVMEFIDGESLEQLIRRRGPVPAHEGIPLFKQALLGVAAAHRAGIIHRDLKASNLMITKDGIVKVMDFGIAKRQGATGATKASTSIGSPLYMAPEQILGRAVDCRTDVYALGVTLYQLLCGQPPFNPRGKTEYSVLNAHVNDLPEPPTNHTRDIPEALVSAVLRALSKKPEERFKSVEDFMCALPDVPAPNAGARRADASPTVAFDYSAATLRQESYRERPGTAAASPPATARLAQESLRVSVGRARLSYIQHPIFTAVFVATLVLGTLIGYAVRVRAPQPAASPPSNPVSAAETPMVPTSDITSARAVPSVPTIPAAPRPDLSGIWYGEYVDASGKPLVRVVNLSISRVFDDGGIEGILQYETASGNGECKLHRRGSSYLVNAQRLQLSPQNCSPHYPRELGVPLDFDGVNPRTNTLKDGRIEAPNGELITVKLKRVSGI